MKYIPLILLTLLAGCDTRSSEQRAADNQASLNSPDVVGQLNDGRTLYHSTVKVSSAYTQHIFYAGEDVTVNSEVSSGKSTEPTVSSFIKARKATIRDVVILDGQRLDVNEVKQALTRDEDQRRKEEQK